MKDQLIKILKHFDITATRFADEIGVQRSSISHILGGRNKPSYDFILKVIEKYPSLNLTWLLTGKGNMILDAEDSRNQKDTETDQQSELFMPDKKPDSDNFQQTEHEIKHVIDISKQNNNVTNVNKIDSVVILYTDGTFVHYHKRDNE
jgi:plasmid maintenance system antidote protein VapI